MTNIANDTARIVGSELKAAVQELLRAGVVYQTSKPNVYRTLRAHQADVASVLGPLDLVARYDDVRGLAFVAVAAEPLPDQGSPGHDQAAAAVDDAWSHPLVRRQRLTLEQSLLLAVLRRRYTDHEQSVGVGAVEPTVGLDELAAELQVYLGATGSESAEERRVGDLLEQLQRHGLVSAVADDEVSIRPLICHVASPSALELLLGHYRSLAVGNVSGRDEEGRAPL